MKADIKWYILGICLILIIVLAIRFEVNNRIKEKQIQQCIEWDGWIPKDRIEFGRIIDLKMYGWKRIFYKIDNDLLRVQYNNYNHSQSNIKIFNCSKMSSTLVEGAK